MSLDKFKADFLHEFPSMATNTKIMAFINNYESIKREDSEAEADADPTGVRLSFGKYRGFLVSDLCKMDAGKQYLTWLYSQSFFDAEKFPQLHKCLSDLGVTKKKAMNANARVARVPAGCV